MTVVVRFAPSPTGYLHIGGARTALFNYLFAKKHHGKFLLRIEDTDKERSTQQAIEAIKLGLKWLELEHDDQIVLQSQNVKLHVQIAQELLAKGQAYQCFTSAQELEEMRNFAEKKGQVFRFQSPWRNKINSQSSTVKPVIRLKSPLEGETVITDLVQGNITVKNNELDDLVLLRSDDTPTYMLAVVVDDHDMAITHIIRGDDHLTNAFRQKLIYQAMSWQVPQFAHIPLIHGSDGAKLSKRHGATSVIDYQLMGYLPCAMRNYLLRLGWSHGDEEIISDEKAIEWFNLENIGRSPSRFDFAKLNHLNHHYLKQFADQKIFELLTNFLKKPANPNEQLRFVKAIKFLKEKFSLITEIADSLTIYYDNFQKEFDEESKIILNSKKNLLNELRQIFKMIDEWNHDNIHLALDQFAKNNSLKIKDFAPALRIALTYSKSSSGGIFEIIEILGQQEVEKRLQIIETCN
ncbi:MAG: hypothetical protein RL769_430 [Pseudomonadota bacterium]|jgi:glutamyl-tRNA synthetase